MEKSEKYFIGLDIGTASVGWAVTDEHYNIPKFNGKKMWGIRLFDEAQTAEARRLQRGSRRRLDRRKERLNLLQDFFAEEITKIDPNFFIRLDESDLYKEDKNERLSSKNALFNDENFKDRDYHKKYPTIHHLIMDLINNDEKKDVRLVYLACHYLLKNRGHFIFEGQEFSSTSSLEQAIKDLKIYLAKEYEEFYSDFKTEEMIEILTDKATTKKEKLGKLKEVLGKSKLAVGIANIILGYTWKLASMFDDESLNETDVKDINFSKEEFEDKYSEYEEVLGDRMELIIRLKAIYDASIVNEFLSEAKESSDGIKYISSAFVAKYEKHARDLKKLKRLIKQYLKPEYSTIFRDATEENNYVAYTKSNITEGQRTKAKSFTGVHTEDFYKFIKIKLDMIKDEKAQAEIEEIKKDIEIGDFLPKQKSTDNGVLPYQLKAIELRKILENQSKYHAFLNKKDSYGTNADKINSIMTFRIPYYVGPLNQHSEHAWIKKQKDEKIYPWNYQEVIDLEGSRERFIDSLIGRCSFLKNEKVLPKSSLLYAEYMVLNELNNLKINSEPISADFKHKIVELLFKKNKKVTLKKVKALYKKEYNSNEEIIFTGTDGDFKQGLTAYYDFNKIIGSKIEEEDYQKIIEKVIKDLVLYADDKRSLKRILSYKYKDYFSTEEIKAISNLKYKDWGRLSEKLLVGIQGSNLETGETGTIMHFMREYNLNLMELMSKQFTFVEEVEKLNPMDDRELCYEMVDELYLSPSVKRMLWQSLKIVEEIKNIMKKDPEKIFIEMTRSKGEKNKRINSRKEQLKAFYKSCKEDYIESQKYFSKKIDYDYLYQQLEQTDESAFKITNLYLYYTQFGRCMYSLEPIDISEIKNKNIYDQDHIFPKSKLYDDSIENRVLVKKELNSKKGNKYPIPDEVLNKNVFYFWKMLKDRGLIGDKKYSRLIRKTPFTEEELSGFIARQIVETGQATKEAANLLKMVCKDSEIVYSKAENVSRFRQEFHLIKNRTVNDLHHAHDAYLNIVVGHVYNTKFTKSPYNFIKKEKDSHHYNLENLFKYDVKRGDTTAWIACRKKNKNQEDDTCENGNATIIKVKKELNGTNFRFTRLSYIGKGELFNATLQRKGSGTSPLREVGPKSSIEKYGGFTNINKAYFILIDIRQKTKTRDKITRKLLPISRECYYKQVNHPDKSEEIVRDYLTLNYGFDDFAIVYPQIKMNSLLKIDGSYYFLVGGSETEKKKNIEIKNAVQLILPNESNYLLKQIEIEKTRKYKYLESNKTIKEEIVDKTFDIIMDKFENSIFSKSKLISSKNKDITKYKNKFQELKLKDKCDALLNLVWVISGRESRKDLRIVGLVENFGRITSSNNITNYAECKLINQSITGLFENELDLLEL